MADFSISVLDFSGERSTTRFRHATPTDTASLTAYQTNVLDISNAIDALILGTVSRRILQLETQNVSAVLPASPSAQRERKMVLFMSDNVTGDTFKHEIGTPDATLLGLAAGSDVIDLAAPLVATLVSEIEAHVLSKNGNAVTVNKAVLAGRNL